MKPGTGPEPGDTPVDRGPGKTTLPESQEEAFVQRFPFVGTALHPVVLPDEDAHEGSFTPEPMRHEATLSSVG